MPTTIYHFCPHCGRNVDARFKPIAQPSMHCPNCFALVRVTGSYVVSSWGFFCGCLGGLISLVGFPIVLACAYIMDLPILQDGSGGWVGRAVGGSVFFGLVGLIVGGVVGCLVGAVVAIKLRVPL